MKMKIVGVVCLLIALAGSAEAQQIVFPQIADGVQGDGSFYQSTLIVGNGPNPGVTPSTLQNLCTMTTSSGFPASRFMGTAGSPLLFFTGASDPLAFVVGAGAVIVTAGRAGGPLVAGYLSLNCTFPVKASVIYHRFAADGATLGIAIVSPSSAANIDGVTVPVYTGGSLQTAFAIANPSIVPIKIGLHLNDQSDQRDPIITVPAKGQTSGFIKDFLTVPIDAGLDSFSMYTIGTYGFYAMGLLFDGAVFTALDQTVTITTVPVF